MRIRGTRRGRRIVIPLLLCSAFFLVTALIGPGDSQQRISERYTRHALSETGAVNTVSAVLLDYRGFDTLGEATVIFAAVAAVTIMMSRGEHSGNRRSLSNLARCAVAHLFPLFLLFPLYVILHGHISPGGGFHGGVTLAVLLILISVVYGTGFSLPIIPLTRLSFAEYSSALSFILVGLAGLLGGSNFLSNISAGFSAGSPGELFSAGFMPLLNIAIGFKVASGLVSIYYHLLQTDPEEEAAG